MKKKDISHPKLYLDFKNTTNGVTLFYYSNKLNDLGKRLIESHEYNENDKFSNDDLINLNHQEYKKLLVYIARQERIMDTYFKKNFNNQYEIVKESLQLMYKFKDNFESVINGES